MVTSRGDTHLYGDLQAYRIDDNQLSRQPLAWRIQPDWADFAAEQFEPWTVVHLAGIRHIYDNGFQKIDVRQVIAAPHADAELEAEVAKLQAPIVYTDDILGELVHDRARGNAYEGTLSWLGKPVHVSIPADQERPSPRAIATLHALWTRQAEADREARTFAAAAIFDGTESSWWTRDGEPPSAAEFADLLSLREISIDHTNADDGYLLWFHDGEVFGGHLVRLEGSLSAGYVDTPQV